MHGDWSGCTVQSWKPVTHTVGVCWSEGHPIKSANIKGLEDQEYNHENILCTTNTHIPNYSQDINNCGLLPHHHTLPNLTWVSEDGTTWGLPQCVSQQWQQQQQQKQQHDDEAGWWLHSHTQPHAELPAVTGTADSLTNSFSPHPQPCPQFFTLHPYSSFPSDHMCHTESL